MRILAGENIPRMAVEALQELGHDVRDVRGTPDRGVPDTALWKVACDKRRLLITTDKGFTADDWPGQLVVMRDAIQSVSRATP